MRARLTRVRNFTMKLRARIEKKKKIEEGRINKQGRERAGKKGEKDDATRNDSPHRRK